MSTKLPEDHQPRSVARKLFGDENRLLTSSLVVLLSAFIVLAAAYVAHQIRQPEYDAGHVLTSNQPARSPAISASISSISEKNIKDPAFTLADDETILIMTLSITNHTSITQDFIPTSHLYVRTRSGDYRPLHASMFVKKQIPGGKILPGKSLTGQISFGVPKSATNPLLYIDTGWDDEAPIVFDVLQ